MRFVGFTRKSIQIETALEGITMYRIALATALALPATQALVLKDGVVCLLS
jgi:hypothetical protein